MILLKESYVPRLFVWITLQGTTILGDLFTLKAWKALSHICFLAFRITNSRSDVTLMSLPLYVNWHIPLRAFSLSSLLFQV